MCCPFRPCFAVRPRCARTCYRDGPSDTAERGRARPEERKGSGAGGCGVAHLSAAPCRGTDGEGRTGRHPRSGGDRSGRARMLRIGVGRPDFALHGGRTCRSRDHSAGGTGRWSWPQLAGVVGHYAAHNTQERDRPRRCYTAPTTPIARTAPAVMLALNGPGLRRHRRCCRYDTRRGAGPDSAAHPGRERAGGGARGLRQGLARVQGGPRRAAGADRRRAGAARAAGAGALPGAAAP